VPEEDIYINVKKLTPEVALDDLAFIRRRQLEEITAFKKRRHKMGPKEYALVLGVLERMSKSLEMGQIAIRDYLRDANATL
jgi:hypothetical protein